MLFETMKTLLTGQYQASLWMLHRCIEQCPETAWDQPVANLKFCQAAFHALFFTDYYLCASPANFKLQPFHQQHAAEFCDYEEMEVREQKLTYDRSFLRSYGQHCRAKAIDVIQQESAESLTAACGFAPKTFSRAELHVYNIRHIQHHAAQLSLRLRLDFDDDISWLGTGWKEA
ncbi:DinB family protein [Blastopirellula sp. J2-11]|uniref:DinB family protein n=1 Tax=Blastopirellula sp. J2-11 TaxID=2943192 RepID=UPI0021CA220D|nr:DinB family protein [Blastopirellula sp. J2-11]UUO06777.1 DinB family protein [Blastopirellula sp. J2-11]